MEPRTTVALVPSDESVARLIETELADSSGASLALVRTPLAAGEPLSGVQAPGELRLVLLAVGPDTGSAEALIEQVHREAPSLPVIVIDGAAALSRAVSAMRSGASDYLPATQEGLSALHDSIARVLMAALAPPLLDSATGALGQGRLQEYYQRALGPGVGIWDLDLGSGQLSATRGLRFALGFEPHELGETLEDWLASVDARDRERLRAHFKECADGDTDSFESEVRFRRADGEITWLLVRGSAVIGPDGRPVRLVGSNTDITRVKLAERALLESEERFRRLAENAPDMIFRWSYKKGFEYVSPASLDVIGYTPEEHYADPGLSYRNIHLDDLPIYESVFSELADPEGPRRYCVVRWQHKEGRTVHVEMRMAPIFDERGELIAIEGIARDVSQHVLTRQRLQELTARVTRAHEDERRRLAHELHDEVGQALTAAKMRLRMVQNALPDNPVQAASRLDQLGSLCDEVLQMVRALSHELRPPLLDEMGWEPAVAWLCESFSERSGMQVHYRCKGRKERLEPEVELVAYRVVQEALTNIARHAEVSEAFVDARLDHDGLHLSVADHGRGFDIAALSHEADPDLGLGVLSMRERVFKVGGALTIDSQPGAGTRIEAVLPLTLNEETRQ